MLSIFNGRSRALGGSKSEVFAQISVEFRDHLFEFKGASLGVFMAIALHANKDGWAWPSYNTLSRETGYSKKTIASALDRLCNLQIEGSRVLLRWQPFVDGRWQSNRYLLFPSKSEIEQWENTVGKKVTHSTEGKKGVRSNCEHSKGAHKLEPCFELDASDNEKQPNPNNNQTSNIIQPQAANHAGPLDDDDDDDDTQMEIDKFYNPKIKNALIGAGISPGVAHKLAGAPGVTLDAVEGWVHYAQNNTSVRNVPAFIVSKVKLGEKPPMAKVELSLEEKIARDAAQYGFLT